MSQTIIRTWAASGPVFDVLPHGQNFEAELGTDIVLKLNPDAAATSPDPSAYAVVFEMAVARDRGPIITIANGGITKSNTGFISIPIAQSLTDTLEPHSYYWQLRRTDTADILSFGSFTIHGNPAFFPPATPPAGVLIPNSRGGTGSDTSAAGPGLICQAAMGDVFTIASLSGGLHFAAGVLTMASGTWQPLDATLTALAGVTTSADQVIYATGSDTFAATSLTSFGRSLIADADAATARSTLGLGSAATQSTSAFDAAGAAAAAQAASQPLDADLTALAAISSTGFAHRTAANTWSVTTSPTFTSVTAGSFGGDGSGLTNISGGSVIGLASVAYSGNYGDLSGSPALALVAFTGSYNDLNSTPSFAPVAQSGNYNDLGNLPIDPSGNWNKSLFTNSQNLIFNGGFIADGSNLPSIDPTNRRLIHPDGSTVLLDWSSGGLAVFNVSGRVDTDVSFTNSTGESGLFVAADQTVTVGGVNGTGIQIAPSGALSIGDGGNSVVMLISALPTSDPHVATQLWNDSGTLKISAG